MSRVIALILPLHAAMLRLYPRPFQEEFGADVQALFAIQLAEAARKNAWSLVIAACQELFELPVNLLDEHLNSMRRSGYLMNHLHTWRNNAKDGLSLVGPILWEILWKALLMAALVAGSIVVLGVWRGFLRHTHAAQIFGNIFFIAGVIFWMLAGFRLGNVRRVPLFWALASRFSVPTVFAASEQAKISHTEARLDSATKLGLFGLAGTLHNHRLSLSFVLAGLVMIASAMGVTYYEEISARFAGEIALPKIDRYPPTADYGRGKLAILPTYDPQSTNSWQMDLRSYDLFPLDATDAADDLLFASFDTRTTWPPTSRMPADFDPLHILELGKDPGLGARSFHSVGLAIIDQPLLVEHLEYAGRVDLYEEIDIAANMDAQMHGSAVASLAVGKTVGVAPNARLYYIATWPGYYTGDEFHYDFTNIAQAVHRILEVNRQLDEERKIRVISISVGWQADQPGYEAITKAVDDARKAGVFVLSTSLKQTHDLCFMGIGRDPLADPNQLESYRPGLWWADEFYANPVADEHCLLVPMDARTTASPTGTQDYVFYRQGGLSWAVPYLAAVYALAANADSQITPERFWQLALSTGRTISFEYHEKMYSLGPMIDPQAIYNALR